MSQIQIKYEEVYAKTSALKTYVNNDLLAAIDKEYQTIQTLLDGVDSATNAKLKEAMGSNKEKAIIVAKTLEKLLSFMNNSSKQVELQESKMAQTVIAGTKTATAGIKTTSGGVG